MQIYKFRTVPLSIIRSLFTVHSAMVYVTYVCRQLSSRTILVLLNSCLQTCMTYTIAESTVNNSWWWTEELSKTCRVSCQNILVKLCTLSSKTQWQNIKSTWENNKNKPRKQAVALFRLNTGHDCLAARLYRIKVLSYNHCSICKQKNTIMDKDHLLLCPKLDQTSKKLSKLYWDARKLME